MAVEAEADVEDVAEEPEAAPAEPEPEDDEESEDGEPKKKRRFALPKLNKFVLIGAAVVVLAGGAAAWFLLFSGSGSSVADDPLARPAFFYDLPQITVNLASEDDQDLFLKLNISLEVSDQSVVQQIEPKLPRVLDAFQVYLRELRKSDLAGSAGIYQLKEELRRRVNLAIYPAEVQSILFKEILVQ